MIMASEDFRDGEVYAIDKCMVIFALLFAFAWRYGVIQFNTLRLCILVLMIYTIYGYIVSYDPYSKGAFAALFSVGLSLFIPHSLSSFTLFIYVADLISGCVALYWFIVLMGEDDFKRKARKERIEELERLKEVVGK